MNPSWFRDLFGVEKPIIAMAHIPALPGTPNYNQEKGIDFLVDWVKKGMPSITGSMKAESPHVEYLREFLGLFIILLALLFHYNLRYSPKSI